MAGAIPIQLTEQELAMLARLQRDEMVRFLTELDEHGWSMARAVLRSLAERRNYPMNNKTKREKRNEGA
jgi:5S rRNA maturation endonuclease (ribonuclease M5)